MDFHDFIEFVQVKLGSTSFDLALEMQVETKKFMRFAKPFVTAKYLNVTAWEEITRGIEKIAKNYMKYSPEKEGEFTTEEVIASWKVVPKENSYIRFEKLRFTYTLDWILQVKIARHTPLPDRPITPDVVDITVPQKIDVVEYEPDLPNDHFHHIALRSRYKPSNRCDESSENNKPTEYSPRPITSPDYGELSNKYTPSKIDSDVIPSSNSPVKSKKMIELFGSGSEDEKRAQKTEFVESSDEIEKRTAKKRQLFSGGENNKPEMPHQKKQTSKKMKVDEKQPTLGCWIAKNQTPTKNSQRKLSSKNKSATKTRSGTSGSSTLDSIDEDKMVKMQSFLEKSKQDEMNRDRRRNELENYDTWDCNDVSRDHLKRMILDFMPHIRNLYANNNLTPTCNKKYNAVLLTTSNVLTEPQISFVCQQIENQREANERGYNEDILTDKILPEFIIHVFCKKYDLSKTDALERLKIQEERRMLFNDNDESGLL